MRIQVYRLESSWKTQCGVNCYTYACFRNSKSYVNTRCFTANTPRSPFAVGKTMETFHPDMTTYVKSCTRTRLISQNGAESYRGQSSRSVVVISHFFAVSQRSS